MTNGSQHALGACDACGFEEAQVTLQDVEATQIGWPGGLLKGVKVTSCGACGETSMAIPAHGAVMRVYREKLCQLTRRLNGDEYAFLRRSFGVNGRDYAEKMGLSNVTVSRVEHGEEISALQDSLIRALTMLDIESRGLAMLKMAARTSDSVEVDLIEVERQRTMDLSGGWQTIEHTMRSAVVVPLRRRATRTVRATFEVVELPVVEDARIAACG